MKTLEEKLTLLDELTKAYQRIKSCSNGDNATEVSNDTLQKLLTRIDKVIKDTEDD